MGLLSPNAEADFRALEREIGGVSGLAVSAVGRGRPVSVVGSLRTGVAWSTIKVPLAIAARDGEAASSVTAAITASDNAAAEALWTSLGDSASAGAAVEAVLAAGGDGKTRVQIDRVRPEFTPFGQTEWPLESQQHFVAGLPCLPEAATVLELMGKVVADQRWAIGAASAGARFKGGWGPGPDGRYLVRQMGIVTLPGGQLLALSIANVPSDGSLSTGSANLTRIAQWAMDHVPPAGLSAAPAC